MTGAVGTRRRHPQHKNAVAIRIKNRYAALHAARLQPWQSVQLPDPPFLHLFVPRGNVTLENADELEAGDAVRFTATGGQRITATEAAEVLSGRCTPAPPPSTDRASDHEDLLPMTTHKTATTAVPLHPLLAERWSPRAFDPTHQLADEDVAALLEAARWAPSANNTQPWRFLVARRDEQDFDRLAGLLATGNRSWAPHASALVLVVAQTTDDTGRARPWALYDTGQAVGALSVQAGADGLHVHQMGGFDADAARHEFGLPDDLAPVVLVAIGRRDSHAKLPEPLAAREQAPRTRLPLAALLLGDRSLARRAA